MDAYVCVRVIQFWGVDLSLFQFDNNQTWAAFFMNADQTVYGRYGSRGGKDSATYVSLAGLKKAMSAVLDLHAGYPGNKASLAGKTGPAQPWRTPEMVPDLKGKHRRDDITQKGCIHCHDVQDAMVPSLRSEGRPVTDRQIWPFPMPDVVGLTMDVRERATVAAVARDSSAGRAGFEAGDRVLTMAGQPLVSIADMQWVLHRAPDAGEVEVEVERGGHKVELTLSLGNGWRRVGDMSWRTMGWHLGKLAGFQMRTRPRGGETLALRVNNIWPPGPGAEAGVADGDVIVEIDGLTSPMGEGEFLAYLSQKKKVGQTVDLVVLREGERRKAKLTMRK